MGFNPNNLHYKNYNEKSCSTLEKPYYRPIEAALRWCGLISKESEILTLLQENPVPALHHFPQWPCLRVNTEKIIDAIENGELPYGRDGKAVRENDHVARARITVRHTDLKFWMAKYYPDQKPDFLFDEIERKSHVAINADSIRALQADRDALRLRIEAAEAWFKEKGSRITKLESENERLKAAATSLITSERNSLLSIIAILCGVARLDYLRSAKAATLIHDMASRMGISIGETTIEDHLKKIPNALETRMK